MPDWRRRCEAFGHMLLHETAHHVDWYSRHWNTANERAREEAADQYAFSKTTRRSVTYFAEEQK